MVDWKSSQAVCVVSFCSLAYFISTKMNYFHKMIVAVIGILWTRVKEKKNKINEFSTCEFIGDKKRKLIKMIDQQGRPITALYQKD